MLQRVWETAAVVLTVAAGAAISGVIRYDQSQTGDYNVHLDLKNVDVLAFLDDSALTSFGEYDYDYGELTLKPPSSQHNSSATDATPEAPLLSSTDKPEVSSSGGQDEAGAQVSSTPAVPAKTARRCGAGFYRDPSGRCRRLRKPGLKLSGLLNQAKNKISG